MLYKEDNNNKKNTWKNSGNYFLLGYITNNIDFSCSFYFKLALNQNKIHTKYLNSITDGIVTPIQRYITKLNPSSSRKWRVFLKS